MYFSEFRLKVFFVFFVFAGIVRAGDIKGLVIDKEMDEPLMGAMIKVEGTGLGAVADIDGRFVIKGLKKGTCTLEVSYISFFPQKMTVEVPARGEIEVKFLLEPDNKQLDEITIVAQKRLELESALDALPSVKLVSYSSPLEAQDAVKRAQIYAYLIIPDRWLDRSGKPDGASLELFEGKVLPGIACLNDKK